jgi:hypothetical protein
MFELMILQAACIRIPTYLNDLSIFLYSSTPKELKAFRK